MVWKVSDLFGTICPTFISPFLNKLTFYLLEFEFLSKEKSLIKDLLERYVKVGKIGRPVRNNSEKVNVEFGLSLLQLTDLDEAEQMFTVNVFSKYVSITILEMI